VPFPRRLLNDDEQVMVEVRPHAVFLAGPSVALALAIAVAVMASTRTNRGIVLLPLLAIVLVALGWFLLRVAGWAATTLVVTDQRLVLRSGVFRRGRELPLGRVDEITITRTLLTRLLGAGDLVIGSAGQLGGEVFSCCPHPRRVRDTIHEQVSASARRSAERHTSRADQSPLEQLDRLDDLRRRGVISQAEFDAKKTQLLDRL